MKATGIYKAIMERAGLDMDDPLLEKTTRPALCIADITKEDFECNKHPIVFHSTSHRLISLIVPELETVHGVYTILKGDTVVLVSVAWVVDQFSGVFPVETFTLSNAKLPTPHREFIETIPAPIYGGIPRSLSTMGQNTYNRRLIHSFFADGRGGGWVYLEQTGLDFGTDRSIFTASPSTTRSGGGEV